MRILTPYQANVATMTPFNKVDKILICKGYNSYKGSSWVGSCYGALEIVGVIIIIINARQFITEFPDKGRTALTGCRWSWESSEQSTC